MYANSLTIFLKRIKKMAPRRGLEPPTYRLTAECSTIELSRNVITNIIIACFLNHAIPSTYFFISFYYFKLKLIKSLHIEYADFNLLSDFSNSNSLIIFVVSLLGIVLRL